MAVTESMPAAGKRKRVARIKPLVLSEATVWKPITTNWRRLYGGFYDVGVSIECHDFELHADFEWSRSFHPASVELCLNLSGEGGVRTAESSAVFEARTAGFYLPGTSMEGWRRAGGRHQFVTIEFSAPFLRKHLAGYDGALHPLIERAIQGRLQKGAVAEAHRMPASQEHLATSLLEPPVFQNAQSLWYQSKVLQLMSEFFFQRPVTEELFCDRQKRLSRERSEQVIALLHQRLAEPPSLEEIGRQVGCSPFYLSRTFSREMAMTIPQYLRKIRMEKAAELLRSGKYNVTEAAMEVGYSSLSHFSQAFCQVIGCCPALYPQARPLRSKA